MRDDMAIRGRREIGLLNVTAVYHGQLISRRTADWPSQNHSEVADTNIDGINNRDGDENARCKSIR